MADSKEIARRDASYVLDWLRSTNAPEGIRKLQERIVNELGGFVDASARVSAAIDEMPIPPGSWDESAYDSGGRRYG